MVRPMSFVFKKIRKRGICLVLIFLFSTVVFARENQVNEDKDKKWREEILAVYKSKGEQALADFVKNQKDKISNQFILDFVESGLKERKEEWLKVCEIMAEEKKDEKTLADVRYNTGKYFRLISSFQKAIDYFDKALSVYIKLNDPFGKGSVYQSKGDIYFYTGDNSSAFEMYDRALTFFEMLKNPRSQGNIYLRKGLIHFYTGENSKALEMYDKALIFFDEAGEANGQANVYMNKGDIYFYTGDNYRALEMYDKALNSFLYLNNSSGIGNVHLRQGNIFEKISEYSKALESFNKALSYFEIADYPVGKGEVYRGKGNIYLYLGNYPKAVEMYDKALYFFEITKNALGKGNTYKNKGNIYLYTCEYIKALEMYEKALDIFKKLKIPLSLASIYRRKGEIYFRTGYYSKALNMYKISIQIFEKINYTLGLGEVHWGIGDIHFAEGENETALEMYEKALNFYKKAGNILGQGNIYISLGDFHLSNEDYSKALEMYNRALFYFEKSEEPMGQGHVYQTKGYIYLKSGEIYKAMEIFEKSLAFYKRIGDIESASFTLYLKAMALEKLGKKNEALSFLEESISKVEKIRGRTPLSEMKMSFMEKIYKQYEDTVIFMLKNKHHDKGFKYAEAMRARVFFDQMAEGLVRLDKGLAPELKQERDKLVAKLSMLNKEMSQNTGKEDEKKFRELKVQYRQVEGEFEELLIKIRLDNPVYASVKYPEPVSVKNLQEKVLKKNELLLRYFIAEEKIHVFLISKEDFKVFTLRNTVEDINRMIEQYLISVEENNRRRMKEYGNALYQILFKPLETLIKNRNNIIIVPDRQLATIPFESFVIDDKKSRKPVYLLEKYRVKYIQSASVLSILREHYQRESTSRRFIGFGDPVYDYTSFKQGKPEKGSFNDSSLKSDEISQIHRGQYQREGGVLNRLEGSGEEVNTIAGLFKKQKHQAVVYEREKATEDKAKSPDIKEFDYIHFSCHGVLGDGFQCLVLSQIPGSPEDGYLTLNEIMNCDYNSKLVVLSACQTGKGKMERAEGVTGLTRAVMYAGSPAVIASLWDVDDKATKELMVRFYRYMLEEELDKHEALRQAKLDLIKSKKYASPVHWSAFVMYGE